MIRHISKLCCGKRAIAKRFLKIVGAFAFIVTLVLWVATRDTYAGCCVPLGDEHYGNVISAFGLVTISGPRDIGFRPYFVWYPLNRRVSYDGWRMPYALTTPGNVEIGIPYWVIAPITFLFCWLMWRKPDSQPSRNTERIRVSG